MIIFYQPGVKSVDNANLGQCHGLMQNAVWIDLYRPTEQEDIIVDAALQIDVPTHPEMQEIELSSRLYEEGDYLFMTATVVTDVSLGDAESAAITFILGNNRLITVRHADPLPFRAFRAKWDADPRRHQTGEAAFAGLMDSIIDRVADILEQTGCNLDAVSHEIFRPNRHAPPLAANAKKTPEPQRDLEELLHRLGRNSDVISRVRESAVSLSRLLSYFRSVRRSSSAAYVEHFESLIRDLGPLSDHAGFLSQKVNFLLDATLGLINVQQNAIIKIFTIAAVLFLPPTLVGTIYGMNFQFMPELNWWLGYPLALVLMVLSAIAPYVYFKRRGWF